MKASLNPSNREALALEQVEQLDPLEYSDRFVPNKYGIVFKEKIYVGDHTSAAFHVEIKQTKEVPVEQPAVEGEGAEPAEPVEPATRTEVTQVNRRFRLEVWDGEFLLRSFEQIGQMSVSHFLFRSNAGLPDRPAEDKPPGEGSVEESKHSAPPDENLEYKHQYFGLSIKQIDIWLF